MAAQEFVLDASFAIPWIFQDEANPASDGAWKSLIARSATGHVPGLWPMEMANVTLRGPRKGKSRPSEEDVASFFAILRKMPLTVHHQGLEMFMSKAPLLVRKHQITSYDSAYLMLALTTGLPLATRDERLRQAAIAEGVEVL